MAEKLVDVIVNNIKTTWEKGSTTETPMRHASIPHFSATVITILIFQIKRIISCE